MEKSILDEGIYFLKHQSSYKDFGFSRETLR